MPFGLRIAFFLFDLFIKAVNWIIIAVLCWVIVLYYLNDFFAVLESYDDVEAYVNEFDSVCNDLGFLVNHKKDTLGITADFLEIKLDFVLM